MTQVTALFSMVNYYVSNVAFSEESTMSSDDLYVSIAEYLNSNGFSGENRINKMIENEIKKIQKPSFEQLQLWAEVVNELRQDEFIYQNRDPQKLQKIKTVLDFIKKNLKVKFDQEIMKANPDNVDFSKFDYHTKEVYKIEMQYKDSPEKEQMVEKKLAEIAQNYNFRGGFPGNLKYKDWVRYKKTLVFFSDNNIQSVAQKSLNSLNKAYLYMFIYKQEFDHSHTYTAIQSFFIDKLDCDDIASFTYFVLLSNGVPANKLNLVAVDKKNSSYKHMLLLFEVNGEYYVLDTENRFKGRSYSDVLKRIYSDDLADINFSICNPSAHVDYFYDNDNYVIKDEIKISEIDSILISR